MNMVYLIWLHFLADCLAQNEDMAAKKSYSLAWLMAHSIVYGVFFIYYGGVQAAALVALSHFFIDLTVSKCVARQWEKRHKHWMFVAVGFDQALHLTVLALMFYR